jgi:hypothetical protein
VPKTTQMMQSMENIQNFWYTVDIFSGEKNNYYVWFESLPKNVAFIRCLVRIKLKIRLLHGVII